MDYLLCISLCFIGLFTLSFGNDLVVNFENATTVDAVDGTKNVHFRCHLNRGAMYVIKNKVEIVHVNPITKEETILSSASDLDKGKPEFYSVGLDLNPDDPNSMVLDFTIKTVRYQDDGIFKCHVHSGGKSDSVEEGFAERELVVHRPLSTLKLKLGDLEPFEQTLTEPLKLDHGDYKVACIAEGSNPATEDLHLSFDGIMTQHSAPAVTAMEGPDRKFQTEITTDFNIVVSKSGKELACQATDSTGQTKTVKLTFEVNKYDPIVTCNDSVAHIGQSNPVVYCIVNYTGLEVDGYSYQIGDSGEIIKEGDANPDKIAVTVSDVSPGVAIVSLDLHRAEEKYLDKHYYLIIDMVGGHTVKDSVTLYKKEAPVTDKNNGGTGTNGGSGSGSGSGISDEGHGVRLAPAILMYMLMCVVALWSSH